MDDTAYHVERSRAAAESLSNDIQAMVAMALAEIVQLSLGPILQLRDKEMLK